ncbi:MAG: hypothetical protein AAGG07_13700 [Planctomycetota bacterium]
MSGTIKITLEIKSENPAEARELLDSAMAALSANATRSDATGKDSTEAQNSADGSDPGDQTRVDDETSQASKEKWAKELVEIKREEESAPAPPKKQSPIARRAKAITDVGDRVLEKSSWRVGKLQPIVRFGALVWKFVSSGIG